MKRCAKCKAQKQPEEFGPDKRKRDGKQSHCRECCAKREYLRRHGTIEGYDSYRELGIKQHKTIEGVEHKHCATCNSWCPVSSFQKNRGRVDGLSTHCRKCQKLSAARYRGDNIEQCDARSRAWKQANPKRVRASAIRSMRKTRSTADGRLRHNIAVSIRSSLQQGKAGRRWESLVGYTLSELKRHLEKKFLPGMSWDNRKDWHIDHKIPQVAFNFQTPEDIDFKRCWSLSNLRPMWAVDNLRKNRKIEMPFQPSLTLRVQ